MLKQNRFVARVLFAVAIVVTGVAAAAEYPSRPVRIVVPFGPGGSTDIVARLVAQYAATPLGQPIVVENRPGASAAIGAESVARAEPDGYTVLLGSSVIALYSLLTPKPVVSVQRDFIPIANVGSAPVIWTVNTASPVKTLAEFVSYVKANPAAGNFATSGVGSVQHLAGELLNLRAGLRMEHILYKSEGQSVADLAGHHVFSALPSYSALAPQLASGKLRPLAVTSRARMKALPEVPTVAESGYPGYQMEYWNGLFVPARTPQAIVDRLSSVMTETIRSPQVTARLEELAFKVEATPSAEFAKQLEDDMRRWGDLIRDARIVLP